MRLCVGSVASSVRKTILAGTYLSAIHHSAKQISLPGNRKQMLRLKGGCLQQTTTFFVYGRKLAII
jgi:hypothetical protein